MIIMLLIPGFVSVVGLAVSRLPGDGVQTIPGLLFCLSQEMNNKYVAELAGTAL